jgi:hypothetical protein
LENISNCFGSFTDIRRTNICGLFASNVLEIGYAVSMLSGLVLLVAGLMLIWYLVKKNIIS